VLCFTAQDVADELAKVTGEPFDVFGQVRGEMVPSGRRLNNPNRRWNEEIRPRRQAILRPLEAFRAGGHKSLEAKVRVRPAAAERPHWLWNLPHLTELTMVSQIVLDEQDAAGETEIEVSAAEGPECPRCWRRTGGRYLEVPQAPGELLCERCASVVEGLPLSTLKEATAK